jgi:hypothetical protein
MHDMGSNLTTHHTHTKVYAKKRDESNKSDSNPYMGPVGQCTGSNTVHREGAVALLHSRSLLSLRNCGETETIQ